MSPKPIPAPAKVLTASIGISKTPGSATPARNGLRSGSQRQENLPQEVSSKDKIGTHMPADTNKVMEDVSDSEGDTLEDLEQMSVAMVWCYVLFGRIHADFKPTELLTGLER